MLKRELVRGVYRNWIINEVARAMTNGEHTYVQRTYGTDPISPPQQNKTGRIMGGCYSDDNIAGNHIHTDITTCNIAGSNFSLF